MALRPRTFRRLVAMLIVAGVLAFAGAWWQQRSARLLATRMADERQLGLVALEDGDPQSALRRLGRYLAESPPERSSQDFDARLSYARARAMIPSAGERHLEQASRLLQDLLVDFPRESRRHDVQATLMDVERQAGRWAQLRRIAEQALDERPEDVRALRMRRDAQEQLGEISAALDDAQQLNEGLPQSLEDQFRTLALMSRAGRPGESLVRRGAELVARHPDDPRFQLVLAMAYRLAGQPEQALACLTQAADAPPPPDGYTEFVVTLAGLFDAAGRYDLGMNVYATAGRSPGGGSPELRQRRALRYWQTGALQEALQVIDVVVGEEVADPSLLAIRALILADSGHVSPAAEALEQLRILMRSSACSAEARREATAWHEALVARQEGQRLPPQRRLAALLAAVMRVRHELMETREVPADQPAGLFLKWLGDLYAELGEAQLAIDHWQGAAWALPAWPEPYRLIARQRLAGGQLEDAERAVEEADRRAGKQEHEWAIVVRAEIAYKRWQAAPSAGAADQAALAAAAHQAVRPLAPETLPLHVRLTALRDREAAIRLLQDRLAQGADPELRIRLARVSLEAQLGLHERLLEGLAQPEALLLRSCALAEAGQLDEARRLLWGQALDEPEWVLVRARFLEQFRPDEAAGAWREAGERFQGDLAVQLAILDEADSVRADRQFTARTIDRVAALTGQAGRRWQLERARWLLAEQNPAVALEAVDLLRNLVRAGNGPDTIEARMWLAEGLMIVGNPELAADHLAAAYELDPSRGDMGLRLIAALERLGRRDEARRLLGRLAAEGVSGARQRVEVAARLAESGEMGTAINLLRQADDADRLDASGATLLAELLAANNQPAESRVIYQQLQSDPLAPASALLSAAVFFAREDAPAAAREALQRLENSDLPELSKLVVRGSYHAQIGEVDEARALFARALEQRPEHAAPWRQALGLEIGTGNVAAARALADAVPVAAAGDRRLAAMIVEARALGGASDADLPQGALVSLAHEAQRAGEQWHSEALAILTAVDERQHGRAIPAPLLPRLESAARQFTQFVPLHAFLIEGYQSNGEPGEASRVARRLAENAPHDATAQQLAVAACQADGRFDEAERYALQWRRTHRGDPLLPDAALARARLMQQDFAGAIEAVGPHVARARANPEQFSDFLALAAEAYAATGQYAQAFEAAQPFLQERSEWRRLLMRLSADRVSDQAVAEQWLQSVSVDAGVGVEEEPIERFELARAWARIGMRFKDAVALQRGRDLLEELVAGPLRSDPSAWEALARTCRSAGDNPSAEAAFRRVLALDPRRPAAANALAYLLLTASPGNAAEALAWASVATEQDPSEAAYQDTLARAHRGSGDTAAAQVAFERALRLDETYLDAMVGLAHLLASVGDSESSLRWFRRLEPLYRQAIAPEPHVEAEFQFLLSRFGAGN